MALVNERIAEMRNLRGLTLDQLAKMVGVRNATISRYEHGDIKTLKADMISALAKALDCSPVYLMGWTDDRDFQLDGSSADHLSKADMERLRKYHALSERDQRVVDRLLDCVYKDSVTHKRVQPYRPINLMTLSVSAGTGITLLDEEAPEPIFIPLDAKSKKADFALEVHGDSMEPDFRNRDLILVRKADAVDEGELGIFGVNGEGYFKKLGHNELISLNPEYDPIRLKKSDDVRCFGRVIGRTRRVYPEDE